MAVACYDSFPFKQYSKLDSFVIMAMWVSWSLHMLIGSYFKKKKKKKYYTISGKDVMHTACYKSHIVKCFSMYEG